MLPLPLSQTRNLGIISHIDAGKTTVSERILYFSGEIHRMGEVHDGEATMDWMKQEQQRGITITASATCCRWKEGWLQLIDTPGHIDFTIEVERTLRILDGAITIFSAVEGVQPQSEAVWRQADRYGLPRLCLINKMDRLGAAPLTVLQQIETRLGAKGLLMQLPLGSEHNFCGVIDLLSREQLLFNEDGKMEIQRQPLPAERRKEVEASREKLLETLADEDDAILEALLEGKDLPLSQLKEALRREVLAGRLFPVFLGAALRNIGIQPLLDAVLDYLPSPLDLPPLQANIPETEQVETIRCRPDAPLCALAFKVASNEGHKLTWARLYAGRLNVGDLVHLSNHHKSEKVSRLFRLHAQKRERLESVEAGEIVAIGGLKEVTTGNTLCSADHPLLLPGLPIPEAVVSLALEAVSHDDREKLPKVLERLQWEDPTLIVREDGETGELLISGMGELHLEIVLERLQREQGVQVRSGRPQVIYRESIGKKVRHREIYHREFEGKILHGEIDLSLRPLARGEGVQIVSKDGIDSALPRAWREGIATTLQALCQGGIITGYPCTDLEICLEAIPFVAGETSEPGLRAAAQRGGTLAVRRAAPLLLEPVMRLELSVPTEDAGRTLGGLQQKRGRIEGLQSQKEIELITAFVPLTEIFGYATELRSATHGRGSFNLSFSHYEPAPSAEQARFGLA
ncbi:MAG: elongation factor G [Desulfuromonas sp.]|nr:MAG: elongation factor G [Desulfuromonas sp.]